MQVRFEIFTSLVGVYLLHTGSATVRIPRIPPKSKDYPRLDTLNKGRRMILYIISVAFLLDL